MKIVIFEIWEKQKNWTKLNLIFDENFYCATNMIQEEKMKRKEFQAIKNIMEIEFEVNFDQK